MKNKIKKQVLMLPLLLLMLGCNGQEKKIKNMDEIIEKKIALIDKYATRPLYGLQVNKSGCRLILEFEGSIDDRFLKNTGESMMLPLNPYLIKAGEQKLKIKILPKEGESKLTSSATVSLTLFYAKDKDTSLKEYQELNKFEYTVKSDDEGLTSFDTVMTFESSIPYNYENDLIKSKTLTSIPNIEELAVKKYNEIKKIAEEYDNYKLQLEQLHHSMRYYNSLYSNREEIVKGTYNIQGLVEKFDGKKELLDISNYTMQFYANEKIVALWQKNLHPSIYLKYEAKNSKGEVKKGEFGDAYFLYMPEGSSELKVW